MGSQQNQNGETPPEGKKFVMDGARIKCSLCSKPEGQLKVTSNDLNLQDMLWANINDTNGAENLIFNGVCNHSMYGDKKPPCQSVIQLGGWTNPASAIVQDAPGVLRESQNVCTPHGNQLIEVVHTGQTTTPTNLHEIEEEKVPPTILMIAFSGGPTGGDQVIVHPEERSDITTITRVYRFAESVAGQNGLSFRGQIITPGGASDPRSEPAFPFVKNNWIDEESTKVIIYGYSWGVDFAVELAEALAEEGITIELLLTVDGSDGPGQNWTVNDEIPVNTRDNYNYYQTHNSGVSAGSWSSDRSSGMSSGSGSSSQSDSDSSSGGSSGFLNFPGSHGSPMVAQDPSVTNVYNHDESGVEALDRDGNPTGNPVNHGSMDEHVHTEIKRHLREYIESIE